MLFPEAPPSFDRRPGTLSDMGIILGLVEATVAPRLRAHAHSGSDGYVYVLVGDGVSGHVHYPIADLNQILGLSIPSDEAGALSAVRADRAVLEDYTREHLVIGTGAEDWTLTFAGIRVLERKAGSYAIVEYEVKEALDPVPRRFTVWYDGIVHALPNRSGLVLVKTSSGFGRLVTEHEQAFSCAPGSTVFDVVLEPESPRRDLGGSFRFVTAQAKEYMRRARKRLGRMLRERSLR